MNINQCYVKWLNRDTGHAPRKEGYFYATDIYKIRKGYLKPKDFFIKKPIEDDNAINLITKGIAMEDLLLKILTDVKAPFEHHQKIKITTKTGLIISGEMDFLFPGKMVIETKFPKDPLGELPERYKDQCEFYHRATGLPVYLGEFPYPMKLWSHQPDDKRWEENLEILWEFNKKLIKIKK